MPNLHHRSINLGFPRHTVWQPVGPNQWTCRICKDSVKHLRHHLSRHINSNRHRWTARYLSQLPLLADQGEGIDAPPTVNGVPTEIRHSLDLCYRQLITFLG